MGFEATLWLFGAGIVGLVASMIGVRRKPEGFKVGLFPWHGMMLLSLLLSVLMAAHLIAVWPK
ncbi:hypothetical protein KCG44_10845 [Pacificimonas sp. WHA3]|uniref:Uncharacterized protein n=1 Tax=Pacificimonas pallii TaxID=2827236 RepID=A0ABS6SG94_9SPHN|nr:hypothetical protein [Pacificimonas pallii]MBV7257280.1 hypothetical protein [Pacificimonas pallii]